MIISLECCEMINLDVEVGMAVSVYWFQIIIDSFLYVRFYSQFDINDQSS